VKGSIVFGLLLLVTTFGLWRWTMYEEEKEFRLLNQERILRLKEILDDGDESFPKDIGADYIVNFFVGDTRVFENGNLGIDSFEEVSWKKDGVLHHLILQPRPGLFARMRSRFPEFVLLFGVVVSCLTSVLLFFIGAFWRAKKRADLANAAKSAFLANMSHEIRTPLNAVIGTTSLLRKMPLDEKVQSLIGRIEKSGHTLLDVISDILDLSKIESGELRLERVPVDVGQLAREVGEILAIRIEDKGLVFSVEGEATFLGDPARLKQVLFNLIGNAIKFTERGCVSVGVALESGFLHLSVSDTGIGIPLDKLDEIFHHFTQADVSHTRRFGGTGLGLAICRRLVEQMGGEITCQSQLGEGATFSVLLPCVSV